MQVANNWYTVDATKELRKLLTLYYNRAHAYILAAPPGSLQLTGVLGLAALLIAYYQLKRSSPPGGRGQPGQATPGQNSSGGLAAGSAGRLGAGSSAAASSAKGHDNAKQIDLPATTPLGRAVRSRLVGIRKVTISALGPLTQEWSALELQEGATLRPEAVEILKEVCTCADTYVICQVHDDVGQAVMTGSLEAAGLLGNQPGQLRQHHLLFCSTLDGKVSIVRQIEPDLHIDGSGKTIEDLKRFMPHLLHLPQPSSAAAGQGSSNVVSSSSLAAFFGH
eukprot:gene3151-3428_t